MTPSRTLELLAPCRTCDIGIEAFKHGADAIYIGGPLFSARANAGNSMSEIERLASFAHRFNGRVYMALNTIFSDEELPEAVRLAHQAYHAGVDALIVQDMGLLMCDLPPIQLHASTQCDIRTTEKAVFLESIGFSQIVPARELTLGQIQEMAEALKTARIEFLFTARFASATAVNATPVKPLKAGAPTAETARKSAASRLTSLTRKANLSAAANISFP